MTMTVMEIRIVWMHMELCVVHVGVTMGFLLMPMLVMGIMRVPMIMRERLVPVSVQMLFRQVQPDPHSHERCREDKL
jgi:hypothetical protein